MTDDGVMMKKWCCTGLLGEIGEICWYMYIHIHTTERFEFWWFIILMISSVLLSPLGFGGSFCCPVWERLSRQWSTSWSSNMRPKIKRRQQLWETATGRQREMAPWPRSFKCCYIGGCVTQMMKNQEDLEFGRLNMMKYDGTTCYPQKLSHRKQGEQL